jgi:hypothetical protein
LKIAAYIANAQNAIRTERTLKKDYEKTLLRQNGGASQTNCARNLLRMLGSFCHGRNKTVILDTN